MSGLGFLAGLLASSIMVPTIWLATKPKKRKRREKKRRIRGGEREIAHKKEGKLMSTQTEKGKKRGPERVTSLRRMIEEYEETA